MEDAKKNNKLTVLFLGEESSDEFKTYEEVARSLDKQTFFHLACDAKCAEELKTEGAKVVLFKTFDELQNNFSGEFSSGAIKQFLQDNSVPTLIEFSEEYVEDIFGKSQNTLFLFADVNSEAYPTQKDTMAALAKELKGKLLFSISDVKDGMQQRLAEFLGVGGKDLPTAYIVQFGAKGIKKFRLEADTIDSDTLKKFISDFEANKLEPTLKSQEPPTGEKEFDEGVKVSYAVNSGAGRQDFREGGP